MTVDLNSYASELENICPSKLPSSSFIFAISSAFKKENFFSEKKVWLQISKSYLLI